MMEDKQSIAGHMHHQTGHLKADSPHVDLFDTRLSKEIVDVLCTYGDITQ